MFGHKTIHINLPFIRSQMSMDVEIIGVAAITRDVTQALVPRSR